MMPVPSYQLLPFLAWLHRRGIHVSNQRETNERLYRLAEEFLQAHGEPIDDSLAWLMAIFQSCPMIRERSIEEQFSHFAGCGACIEHIREGRGRRRGGAFHEGHGFAWPLGSDSMGTLHPLLRGFVELARGSEVEAHLLRGARRRALDRDSEHDWFREVIHEVGRHLERDFRRYLEEVRQRTPGLIEDYERWRETAEQREPRAPLGRGRRFDENTQPLGANESLEQAAHRLADSVRLAIESGFYDELISEEPQIARLFSLVMESSEHVPQALEFMTWLREKEPDLRIQGNIPASEFAVLALQFCEEQGYPNGQSFSQEAARWLGGGGSHRIIDRIARFLKLNWRSRSSKGEKGPRNLLDRYGAVRFHALFLFLSSGDFPSFIDTHWRDLNHLTGDDLDIYFSQKDLGERTSAYEIVQELRTINLRVDSIPALLLWEDVLGDGIAVPLHALGHSQVVEVVQAVVQAIRDGCALNDVAARGADKATVLRESNREGVLVASGASLIINNGGVMGDIYDNKGVVGAMGANAVAHDNVFLQDARKVLSEVTLTAADASIVVKLAEALATKQIEGISLTARLEGAKYLAALAESANAGQVLDEPLAGWKKWMSNLGERAGTVLSVLANVVTIASPVAKLLGLPL